MTPMSRMLLLNLIGAAYAAPLTVHLVPHTHDDVGWLKTVDEYYSGANNSIQHASVRNILNSVVMSLQQNPARKFTYVEQAFFQRWWRELSKDQRTATVKLVKEGQLNFVNGGWCMHDEAATHYVDMVDQTTLGHRWLKEEFGDDGIPTVGWQLDPFGHSATNAALLSAEVGFNSLFFGRIDYQDIDIRRKTRRAEFVWRASPSLGADAQVFTGLSGEYGGNYGPPSGFNWNLGNAGGNDEPVETNRALSTYNVPARVEAAVQQALIQANMTRGANIMWTMGSDFNYEGASGYFSNMDKLIDAVNADGRIRMQYSSPADYVKAKKAEAITWPLDEGTDFFPYADGPHQFWTGYFTSRPALKGYVRTSSALFGASRMSQALASGKNKSVGAIERLQLLEEALGVAQHHDAATGTSKQHVAFDYARRLAAGGAQGVEIMSESLRILHGGRGGGWQRCERLNETVCALTQLSGKPTELAIWNSLGHPRSELITIPVGATAVSVRTLAGAAVPVQVYTAPETVTNYARDTAEANSVASFVAELPAAGYASYVLTPSHAASSPSLDAQSVAKKVVGAPVALENEFLALQFAPNGLLASVTNKESKITTRTTQSFCYYLGSEGDKVSGQASGAYIFRPKTNTSCVPIEVDGGGATIELHVDGSVVNEVRQRFSPWLTQTVRLAAGARHAEFEFTVGPVPFEDPDANTTQEECVSWRQTGACSPSGPREPDHDLACGKTVAPQSSGFCECFGGRHAQEVGCGHVAFTCDQACKFTAGREVVSRFNTSIASGSQVLTDSNGREMLLRSRNERPTWNLTITEGVAGNYYPINSAVAIRDSSAQLTLLVDRAVGAASVADGELEIMVHRRLLKDDGRGVGEPLNETRDTASYATPLGGAHTGPGLIVRGLHRLTLEAPATAARVWRPLADRTYAQAQLLISQAQQHQGGGAQASNFSALSLNALPASLQLMTLQALSPTSILLRLSHQYGLGEDAELSKPVTVDVAALAPAALAVTSVKEVSLTNNQDRASLLRKRATNLEWSVEGGRATRPHAWRISEAQSTPAMASLGPLEIKTFVVTHH
jgi:alpha-mannosidase